jgi:hypothetical protein
MEGGRPVVNVPISKLKTRDHHAETIVVWRACLSGENLRRQEREKIHGEI